MKIHPQQIIAASGRYFHVSPAEIASPSRNTKSVATARMVAMLLCRRLTGKSPNELGRDYFGRDHSTVVQDCQAVKRNEELMVHVRLLEKQLGAVREAVGA